MTDTKIDDQANAEIKALCKALEGIAEPERLRGILEEFNTRLSRSDAEAEKVRRAAESVNAFLDRFPDVTPVLEAVRIMWGDEARNYLRKLPKKPLPPKDQNGLDT